ncbi:MAG: HD domain-containing protein, partial [Deltaproteobacteria bacterium]|nr:HD domain-containing protein [Deltaproteobacteria bacterium]
WTPDAVFEVPCGRCGQEIEFFKDDARRKCPSCGNLVTNPKLNLGCARWCAHAKECLGYDPAERIAEAEAAKQDLAGKLLEAADRIFGGDEKRKAHTRKVVDFARKLLSRGEENADPRVVLAAAALHDVGIPAAEAKHGSAAGKHQQEEGAPIAEGILKELGVDADTAGRVVDIVAAHHTPRGVDSPEFRILWDADHLANLPGDYPDFDTESLGKLIDKVFSTTAGKHLANELYASPGREE